MRRFPTAAKLLYGAAVATSVALVAGQAWAVSPSPNGSFSGALIGGAVTTTFGGGAGDWRLGVTTTQIQITGGSRVISGFVDPYLSNPNNLLAANGGPISVGDAYTLPISVFNIFTGAITPFNVNIDGLIFTLTSEIVTSLNDGNIGLAFLGTITGDTSASANSPYALGSAADFSVGFTEASATGAIAVADSIDTPTLLTPPVTTPEPATLAILGVGLFGLLGVRRRSVQGAQSVT